MNIHEYQAKELFRRYGLSLLPGKAFKDARAIHELPVLSLEEIANIGPPPFAVKAQIQAGGRGKAGGIKIADTPEDAFKAAKKMFGSKLQTAQTAGVAKPVDSVLIEVAREIKKELYVAITLDREAAFPCVICSESGGMEIEHVARESPEKILKRYFGVDEPIASEMFRPFLSSLFSEHGKKSDVFRDAMSEIISKLARLFVELDASLVEVNPLGLLADDSLVPIDAKINFDDNALFRHPEVTCLRDARQEDERENEAKQFDLSYVGLEGDIGCMVNGAGLAMATMDIIKLDGGEPANFLDVGGGASKEKVAAAFKIILKDPRVKAILVNIFGGIMRCDVLAEGIVAAQKEVKLKVPLIVRLEGTNVDEGREILRRSKIPIISADTFEEAAEKAVEAVR